MLGAMGMIGRLAGIVEKLMEDSGLREKWETDGRVSGRVRIEDFDLSFELKRRSDEE